MGDLVDKSGNDLPQYQLTPSEAIAASYALGFYSAAERSSIEIQLERNPELQRRVVGLLETATDCMTPEAPERLEPRPELKERVLREVDETTGISRLMQGFAGRAEDSLVITDARRRVIWANPAFSDMCGYSLQELRGEKLGKLLHGEKTDLAVVQRIREGLEAREAITAELINYHKNGNPYRVKFTLNPVVDANGGIRGFISLSKELVSPEVSFVGK